MPERDPYEDDAERGEARLDALRDAWRSLRAPDATPEDDAVDPLTRASVDWLRDAWAAVEPPAARPPARLVWSQRLRGARRQAPILVAAAALVVFALVVWRLDPGSAPAGAGERVAQAPTPSVDVDAPAEAPRPERAPAVVAAAPEPNAIVLEHGSVRLVLLDADEVTTTIEHEPELNPAGRREAPAPPEEGTR